MSKQTDFRTFFIPLLHLMHIRTHAHGFQLVVLLILPEHSSISYALLRATTLCGSILIALLLQMAIKTFHTTTTTIAASTAAIIIIN